jgi:hypothetical protein
MSKKFSKLMTVLAFMLSSTAYAGDNVIFLNQIGDNSTVTMTQDGVSNTIQGIRSVGLSPYKSAIIAGDSNTVTVSQIGSDNELSMEIDTTIAAGATGNNFTYSVTGNNATAVIDSNGDGTLVSASNIISVTQTGDYANLDANVIGSKNTLTASTTGGSYNSIISSINGDSNSQTITVTGGGNNQITVSQGSKAKAATADTGLVLLNITGASNTVSIDQTGGIPFNGSMGSIVEYTITGSSNSSTITQSGTSANNVFVASTVGNGNVVNITQSN